MTINQDVINILSDTLNLGNRKFLLQADYILLGNIPELDSMAVINVITALENFFDIVIEDDEINANTFETLATLCSFVNKKLSQ